MNISSRTPEGLPNRCPVCGADLRIEPSDPARDAPCPCCGHLLWFTWEDLGDVQVIRVTDRVVDAERQERLFQSMVIPRGRTLILDFSDVPFLSSKTLGALIHLKKRFGTARAKLRFRSLHPNLRDVFRICHLDQIFEIEP